MLQLNAWIMLCLSFIQDELKQAQTKKRMRSLLMYMQKEHVYINSGCIQRLPETLPVWNQRKCHPFQVSPSDGLSEVAIVQEAI